MGSQGSIGHEYPTTTNMKNKIAINSLIDNIVRGILWIDRTSVLNINIKNKMIIMCMGSCMQINQTSTLRRNIISSWSMSSTVVEYFLALIAKTNLNHAKMKNKNQSEVNSGSIGSIDWKSQVTVYDYFCDKLLFQQEYFFRCFAKISCLSQSYKPLNKSNTNFKNGISSFDPTSILD